MATKALTRTTGLLPDIFEDFFRPWDRFNGNFWGRMLTVPAVNIVERDNDYRVELAAPGLRKDDFRINLEGDMLTISCEKKEEREEREDTYTRNEYNYSSFSRSFNIPEEVEADRIKANYEDGILQLSLPKKEGARKPVMHKKITVS